MDDLVQAIGRLKRAQPRNTDMMLVCERLESLLIRRLPVQPKSAGGFDKTAYMKDYMRRRRAEKRNAP